MDPDEVSRLVEASSIGQLCWVDEARLPEVRGVLPLVRDGRPTVAFTYADEQVARQVAGAGRVALALTETRSTRRHFRPVLLEGRPRLVEDPTGDLFVAGLVEQELHRYPPSRVYADSPLLMREHWWYLPRLLVEVEVDSVTPVGPRTADMDRLLVVAHTGAPVVRTAGVRTWAGDRLDLDTDGAPVPPGPAVVFGQDATFPDLEQWEQWHYRGHWHGAWFTVTEAPAYEGLGEPPGLMQRWRRQRDLQRRCVRSIPRS